ncbi:putative secoisolariciresinol dehydrogenase [Helianthus annuus]|nr:putative secoisolariciresinol dehydrogenase [Helianthus annuus]
MSQYYIGLPCISLSRPILGVLFSIHKKSLDLGVKHFLKTLKNVKEIRELHSKKVFYLAPYSAGKHWSLIIVCPDFKFGYLVDFINEGKTHINYKLVKIIEEVFEINFKWHMAQLWNEEGYFEESQIENLVSDVKNAVDTAISEFGKLDIMFNNAGIPGNIELIILNADNENFKRVLDVNVYGSFLGAKHATRVMIPAKCGVILFTSSSASVVSGEAPHAYTVSKHAVVGLMKNLCVELGQHGIRVNCISPGSVSTPFLTNAMGLEKAAVDDILCQSAVLKGWCLRRRMWRRRRCF